MDKNLKRIPIKSVEIMERENEDIDIWGIKHNLDFESKEVGSNNEETYRTRFRRERDRILYSGGFRRLQDKTQVMSAVKNGDHRTRLTHSLEVEQIATSIAYALKLNKDLVSAISLGHDVGHTPFGHAVERFLDKKLKNDGGFSHAIQSARYLTRKKIELSYEIIEGILKHDTDVCIYDTDNKQQFDCTIYNVNRPGTLEAQTVYWSDKIAYITHDYEDFVKSNLLDEAIKKGKLVEFKVQCILANLIVENKESDLSIKSMDILIDIKNFETRDLIRNILSNLINTSCEHINQFKSEYNEDDISNKVRDYTDIQIKSILETEEYKFLKGLVDKMDIPLKEEVIDELLYYYEDKVKGIKDKIRSNKLVDTGDKCGEIDYLEQLSICMNDLYSRIKGETDKIKDTTEYKELSAKRRKINNKNEVNKQENIVLIQTKESIAKIKSWFKELDKVYDLDLELKDFEKIIEKIKDIQYNIKEKKNQRCKIQKEDGKDILYILENNKVFKEYIEMYEKTDVGIEDLINDRINKIRKQSYQKGLLINLSNDYWESYLKLRQIIDKFYIGSLEVQLSDAKAEKIVESLYDMFTNNVDILPGEIREQITCKSDTNRIVADYIASMSDRYAEEIYMNLNSTGKHYDY